MSTAVSTVSGGEPAETAYSRMREQSIHHLVVVDGDRITGIVSDRDIGGRRGPSLRRGRTVGDVMSPHAITAAPDTTVREAANLLRGRTIGCLPVVDGKKLVGIVTVTDLLELLGRGAERPTPKGKRWGLTRAAPRWEGIVEHRPAARRPARKSR